MCTYHKPWLTLKPNCIYQISYMEVSLHIICIISIIIIAIVFHVTVIGFLQGLRNLKRRVAGGEILLMERFQESKQSGNRCLHSQRQTGYRLTPIRELLKCFRLHMYVRVYVYMCVRLLFKYIYIYI